MPSPPKSIAPEFLPAVEALPTALRRVLDAELRGGNTIVAVDHGFPAPLVGAVIRLRFLPSPARRAAGVLSCAFPDGDRSAGYRDEHARFFVLGPPAVARAAAAAAASAGSPSTRDRAPSPVSYHFEAMPRSDASERAALEKHLLANGAKDWRDVQALAALGSPKARRVLSAAFKGANPELAMAILRYAPEVATDAERAAAITRALEEAGFFGELSAALDQAAMFHPPEVEAALWRGVREREGAVAVHFAALLCFIHGKASEPFDNEQRPWFLRFHTENREERAAMVAELQQKLGLETSSPEARLAAFLDKYSPAIAKLAREVRAKMQERLPGAVELVYDNYNALVIGYGPSEKTSEGIFSIALYPRWVTLFFLQGAGLADPQGLLKGSGSGVRHIVLESAADLDQPGVRKLMAEALKSAVTPIGRKSAGGLVIKSVSAKQRPRRPGARGASA